MSLYIDLLSGKFFDQWRTTYGESQYRKTFLNKMLQIEYLLQYKRRSDNRYHAHVFYNGNGWFFNIKCNNDGNARKQYRISAIFTIDELMAQILRVGKRECPAYFDDPPLAEDADRLLDDDRYITPRTEIISRAKHPFPPLGPPSPPQETGCRYSPYTNTWIIEAAAAPAAKVSAQDAVEAAVASAKEFAKAQELYILYKGNIGGIINYYLSKSDIDKFIRDTTVARDSFLDKRSEEVARDSFLDKRSEPSDPDTGRDSKVHRVDSREGPPTIVFPGTILDASSVGPLPKSGNAFDFQGTILDAKSGSHLPHGKAATKPDGASGGFKKQKTKRKRKRKTRRKRTRKPTFSS